MTTGGTPYQVVNPANGNTVAELALATAADVDAAVASARAALPGWKTATPRHGRRYWPSWPNSSRPTPIS